MYACAARLARTQVNGDVHVASVSPNIVPDRIVVGISDGAAFLETHAWHEAVQVVVEAIAGARPEIALVVDVSIGVQSGDANDSAIQATRRNCLAQAGEYTLNHRDAVEFVSVNGSRE